MCGIVGAIAKRPVSSILLEGLKCLEYRGYDSAGIAIIHPEEQRIQRLRTAGKVANLVDAQQQTAVCGHLGIGHTRWATHGKPNRENAHPQISANDQIAVVHNGIIENYEILQQQLMELGYAFQSQTDTEVVGHLIHHHLKTEQDLFKAIARVAPLLKGAYALGIISDTDPQHLYAVRQGCPLVIGLGIEENFIASDPSALLPVTQKFIYLEEGDVARLSTQDYCVIDQHGQVAQRAVHLSSNNPSTLSKGHYRHYMQKEIFEQPQAIANTLAKYHRDSETALGYFGPHAAHFLKKIKRIQIIACGTSYHAGLIGQYCLEALCHIPCYVDVASEHLYRRPIVEPDTLLILISQSGETADTLGVLRQAKSMGYTAVLGISNVSESSLAREADARFITEANLEIGVAATKTFTTQLTALFLLATHLGRDSELKQVIQTNLQKLPEIIEQTLELDQSIRQLARHFNAKQKALFIARGILYPIALEGALKLKEISYIHAQAYPAGELKHGALALVDEDMPVIALVGNDALSEKMAANIQEVRARGGELFIFINNTLNWKGDERTHIIPLPNVPELLSPIIHTIPMQLLAYHIAVLKGTDVDQPRNLAKSVTVE